MTLADVPTVARIETAATSFPWSASLFEDCIRAGHDCQVYFKTPETIIAYTVIQQILDESHLLNICVATQAQGKGYGRCIIKNVIEFAQLQKSVILLLEVRASNQHAQSLYQRIGFNEMSIRRHYYPAEKGREDAILMGLMLF